MKKLYILIILLGIAANVLSQDKWGEVWGPPFPLTDSLTDNVNATLSVIPSDFIQPDTLYMLWERSSDTLSTEIYARNLTTMSAPFLVVSLQNVHFKHPRIFRRGTGDTLFYFSYETNLNGNWDIYYSILMKNGPPLGPFPFIASSGNERSLNWGNPQTFSWEKDGSIYIKEVAGDTVLLCSDSCANPVQSGDTFVAYEMTVTGQQGIFYSKFDIWSNAWTGPFPTDVYGINKHPTFGNDSYSTLSTPYLFWQHKDGPNWEVKGFDINSTQYCTINNFPGSDNLSPSFTTVFIPTRQDYLPNVHFFTFASDVSGNMEVYVNEILGDTTYSSISLYSGTDTHPQLFNNFQIRNGGFDNQLFDIWESFRGGHWQLWATKMDLLSGENDLKIPESLIKCTPNPFTDFVRIEYFILGESQEGVEIYDLNGKKIIHLKGTTDGNGRYTAAWDGKDDHGNPVPAGIYMGAVNTGKTLSHCKIIRH